MGLSRFNCCYHCQDRNATCHANCERYAKQVDERKEELEAKRREAEITGATRQLAYNRVKSLSNHKNKGRQR